MGGESDWNRNPRKGGGWGEYSGQLPSERERGEGSGTGVVGTDGIPILSPKIFLCWSENDPK